MVRLGRHVGGHDLERHVPEVGGDGQRAPAEVDGPPVVDGGPGVLGQERSDPPEAPPIVEIPGEGLRLGEHLVDPGVVAGRQQRVPEGEAQVDRPLCPFPALR